MASLKAISAGSATSHSAVFWARASAPVGGALLYGEERYGLRRGHRTLLPIQSDTNADNTIKVLVDGLNPATRYLYTFEASGSSPSGVSVGLVKTAPAVDAITGVRFGFSGCAAGDYAPINSVADIAGQNLDFFVMLGDAAYEDDYTRAASDPRGPLNSPDAQPPFDPNAPQSTSQSAIEKAVAAMHGKYSDMQNPAIGNLAPLYRSQGIVAAYDNHEMMDMALEAGGAPRTAIQTFGNKNSFREGADLHSANVVFNQSGTFLNQTPEHRALVDTWFESMPLQDLGRLNAPLDARSHGTRQLYGAQQWGRHALYINVDTRSYRDAKITAVAGGEDDVTGPEIDLAAGAQQRTMLGSTQLAWLKQTLLEAKTQGTTWKFVSLSSPIDITGIPGSDGNFTAGQDWVDAKSWWGNYRYERNDLLKFISDNSIKNVVFIATDDHEARINELTYVPTVNQPDDLTNPSLHRRVDGAISVVASPLGATRPDAWIKDGKTKADIVTASRDWNNVLSTAGYDPIGLSATTPGFVSFRREAIGGHVSDPANPLPIDFWSPDTFNYALVDVNASGQLTVGLRGIDGTGTNSPKTPGDWPAIAQASDVREILSFTLNPLA